LETWGPYILGASVIFAVLTNFLYKKYEKVRLLIDRFMLKIYIVGAVITPLPNARAGSIIIFIFPSLFSYQLG
jgi:type II secretory pathway component PulF